jgi:hypothetical protein
MIKISHQNDGVRCGEMVLLREKAFSSHHCDDSFDGLGGGAFTIRSFDQGAAQIFHVKRDAFEVGVGFILLVQHKVFRQF